MASARCVQSVTSINRLYVRIPSPTLHLSFVHYNLKLPGAGNCMQINIARPLRTIKSFVRKTPTKFYKVYYFCVTIITAILCTFIGGTLSALGIVTSL